MATPAAFLRYGSNSSISTSSGVSRKPGTIQFSHIDQYALECDHYDISISIGVFVILTMWHRLKSSDISLSTHLPAEVLVTVSRPFAEGLLHVINARAPLLGLLPALRGVTIVLRAIASELPRPGLADLISDIDNFVAALVACESTASHLRARPDKTQVSPQYWLMVMASEITKSREGDAPIQLVGAAMLSHLAAVSPMPAYRAEDLQSLIAGRDQAHGKLWHWNEFAEAVSLHEESLQAVAAKSQLKVMRELGPWLAMQVTHVRNLEVLRRAREAIPPVLLGVQDIERITDEATVEEEDTEDDFKLGSVVRWSFQRAVRGSSAGSAGLTDWNCLTPGELRRAVEGVIAGLKSDKDLTRRLALCAVLSLAVGLPIRMLLRISIIPNGDLWLDLTGKHFVWDLRQLVDREPVSTELLDAGYLPAYDVCLPLPEMAASLLPAAIDGAMTIAECLFPDMGMEAICSRFGTFLRERSRDQTRKPYTARYAYSLGAAIIEATGDSVAAGYGTLDFRHLAASEFHYLCLPAKRIHEALACTYAWLGLGPLADTSRTCHIGSPLAPRPENYWGAVERLSELQAHSASDNAGESSSDAIEHFNRRAIQRAALWVLLSGERGTGLERRTFAALYGHPSIAIIFDKETEAAAERPIPITSEMSRLLGIHLDDIRRLQKWAKREGEVRLANRLRQMRCLERPNSPAFFVVRTTHREELKLAPVRTGDIQGVLRTFGLAHNAGRHFLLSELADQKYPPYLRRILSGHGSKAQPAFHYAAGLPPVVALNELRSVLEGLTSAKRNGDGPHSKGNSNVRIRLRSSVHTGLRDAAVEAYARQDKRNVGRQSRRFSLSAAAYYSHACEIRNRLLGSSGDLGAGASLLLCLMLVDGIDDPVVCQMLWQRLVDRDAVRLKNTLWVELELPSGRRRVFSPLVPTMLALAEYRTSHECEEFDVVQEVTASWLRHAAPAVIWPDDVRDVIASLCYLTSHLALFELPPWIVSAESPALASASISLSSLERKAFGKPIKDDAVAIALSYKKRRARNQTLRSVLRHVNHCANPERKLGEDTARKKRLVRRMLPARNRMAVVLPMVEAVIEYVLAEALHTSGHTKPIAILTLAGYSGELAPCLEARLQAHPMDFSEDDWRELYSDLKGMAKQFDPSALRRFARYWRMQGASVPPDIFAGEKPSKDSRSAWSTASTFMWEHEFDTLRHFVLAQYLPGSQQHEVVERFLDTMEATPMRASERNLLRLVDLDVENGLLIVTSSGFSHLKGEERSRRVVTIDAKLAEKLKHLRDRLVATAPSREYFFFSGREPSGDPEFGTLVQLASIGLRLVTGDTNARTHALRGVRECRLTLPDLDKFVEKHLYGDIPGTKEFFRLPSGEEGWRRIVWVAGQSGHHPLTAIGTYLTLWPLVARQLRIDLYGKIWPGEMFSSRGAMSYSNLRVLKHRAITRGDSAFGIWTRLQNAIDLDQCATSALSAMGEPLEVGDDLHIRHKAEEPDEEKPAQTIWRAALQVAGVGAQAASDLTNRSNTRITQRIFADIQTDHSKNASSADLTRAMQNFGLPLAERFAEVADTDILSSALAVIQIAERDQQSSGPLILSALKTLDALLPKSWGIALLPEMEGLPRNVLPSLKQIRSDITIKPPSRSSSTRFRLLVSLPGASRTSPRSQGVGTAVVSIVLKSARARLLLQQNLSGRVSLNSEEG